MAELLGEQRNRIGHHVGLEGLEHWAQELLRVAVYLGLGDHGLVLCGGGQRGLLAVGWGKPRHETVEVLLRPEADDVGLFVPCGDVFRKICLGDAPRGGDGFFQSFEPCGSGSLASQKRVVAACSSFVEPLAHAIGAEHRARELFNLDMERLVGREVGLAHGVLAVGITRDVRDQCLFFGGIVISHDDDLGRNAYAAKVGFRKFLFGEVDRGRRLSAVDDLKTFEPQDAGGAFAARLVQFHLVGDDHDAVVVGHETLGGGAQGILNASVHALAFDT